jgi:AcrR family transcriptional regulator
VTADHDSRSRAYVAPQREAAARETRRRIREAARDLFLAQGYAGTSMRAVAAAARVAEKTVYLQYDSKAALLKEVVETAIVGDDADIPVAERAWFTEALAEPQLERKLRLMAEGGSALLERTGPMFAVARGAAEVEAEVARMWGAGKEGHRLDMRRLALSLRDGGLLPPGQSVDWATATLYVVMGLETWLLLREELGYGPRAYRTWLLTTLRATFPGHPAEARWTGS